MPFRVRRGPSRRRRVVDADLHGRRAEVHEAVTAHSAADPHDVSRAGARQRARAELLRGSGVLGSQGLAIAARPLRFARGRAASRRTLALLSLAGRRLGWLAAAAPQQLVQLDKGDGAVVVGVEGAEDEADVRVGDRQGQRLDRDPELLLRDLAVAVDVPLLEEADHLLHVGREHVADGVAQLVAEVLLRLVLRPRQPEELRIRRRRRRRPRRCAWGDARVRRLDDQAHPVDELGLRVHLVLQPELGVEDLLARRARGRGTRGGLGAGG